MVSSHGATWIACPSTARTPLPKQQGNMKSPAFAWSARKVCCQSTAAPEIFFSSNPSNWSTRDGTTHLTQVSANFPCCTTNMVSQFFSDPGRKKREPFLGGRPSLVGPPKKRGKIMGATEQLRFSPTILKSRNSGSETGRHAPNP